MPPTQRRVLSSVALVLLTVLWGRSAGAQTTERVSVASGGTTEGNDTSLGSALSADGRFVAFDSAATDLVAADTNGESDVFVHDRQTGTTERVSVASDGAQGNGSSGLVTFAFPPALSADGRFVAFVSAAANLVASDTNGATDVFVHDRQTGTTERVSVASDGTESNAASVGSSLSADGRFVAFHSAATNLVAGDTNGATDVFVHDRQTGTTERVSVASGGTQGNDSSAGPALSAAGLLVAFHSTASNLVAGDANRAYDIFVHELTVSTTTTSTTQPATTSTSSTTTTTSSSTTRPPTTTSTTTTQPTTTTTRPTTSTSTTTTSTTTTSRPTTTATTMSSTTTQPTTTTTRPTTSTSTTTTSTTTSTRPTTTATTTSSTTTQPTTTRPTTTTLACELGQLAEDSLAGVVCAIGAVRATLNSPPQPTCECKHCSLEPALDRIAGLVMQADGATRPKKCKRNLGKARRAAKALSARVASLTRRRCLAPADRVANLGAEVSDLAGRTRALFKSRFCARR